MNDEKLGEGRIKNGKDKSDREAEWYHYVELFLLQGPILFPAIALDVSGLWKEALPEVAVIDLVWALIGVAAAHFLSKWVGLFVAGWVLVATVDFAFFGRRVIG